MEAVSQIVNTMKDLKGLASGHGIEPWLCSNNDIERIYHLLGNIASTKGVAINVNK